MAKRKASTPKPAAVPREQWDMPATYSADGSRMATFRELVDPNVPTLSLSQLDRNKLAELVAKRIELQPKYEMMMVGAGAIDKDRAITEVKAQTEVGRVLTEIEQRTIRMLAERATSATPVAPAAKVVEKAMKDIKLAAAKPPKKKGAIKINKNLSQ